MTDNEVSLELKLHQALEQLLKLSEQNTALRSENAVLKRKLALNEAVEPSTNIISPTQELIEECEPTIIFLGELVA